MTGVTQKDVSLARNDGDLAGVRVEASACEGGGFFCGHAVRLFIGGWVEGRPERNAGDMSHLYEAAVAAGSVPRCEESINNESGSTRVRGPCSCRRAAGSAYSALAGTQQTRPGGVHRTAAVY